MSHYDIDSGYYEDGIEDALDREHRAGVQANAQHAVEIDELPECLCAMTEASMRTCPRHGEEPWVEHTLTEYGTTTCPVEAVRSNVDDGECSACGGRVNPPAGTEVES